MGEPTSQLLAVLRAFIDEVNGGDIPAALAQRQGASCLEKTVGTGYTTGMKTAVSIPDSVFEEADRLAKSLNTSRSELYARALARFIGEHAPDQVTESINAVVEAVGAGADEFVQEASRRVLERADW